jgi:hypothetical protein
MSRRIQARIEEGAGVARWRWPVTHGCPFAQGALHDPEGVRLVTTQGAELPLQTAVLARWPDGSIQWLLLDSQADLQPKQSLPLYVEYGEGVARQAVTSPLQVRRTDEGVEVETGAVNVALRAKGVVLIAQAGDCLRPDAAPQFTARDAEDTVYVGQVENLEVEEQNALRTVVKAEGGMVAADGRRPLSWTARYHFFAHQPYLRLYHTFTHDADEPVFFSLQEMKLELPLGLVEDPRIMLGSPTWDIDRGGDFGVQPGRVQLWQNDVGQYSVLGLTEGRIDRGCKSHGWIYAGDGRRGVQLKLRFPSENYPKCYAAQRERLELHLYPDPREWAPPADGPQTYQNLHVQRGADYGAALQIPQGMAKTHEVFLYFGEPAVDLMDAAVRAAAWQHPLLLELDSTAYADSGVFGPLPRYYHEYWWLEQKLLQATGNAGKGQLSGMLSFGDTGEVTTQNGRQVTLTTDNVGYDYLRSVLFQYLRRGEQPLFWRAEAMALHFMDVDVLHHSTVYPQWQGGPCPIWQQFHHYTDTTHTRQARPGTDHTWFGGLKDFYYVTGYRRALEVVDEIGRYCAGTEARNHWTKLVPGFRDHWTDPRQFGAGWTRKAGWALVGMAELYEARPDPELARQMRQMVEVFGDWQDAEGRFRTYIGSFHRGDIPLCTAAILTALMRTWQVLGDEQARELCLKGCRFVASTPLTKEGLMCHKESPIMWFYSSTAILNFRPLVFAYAQTGDRSLLRCLWRHFRWWLETGGQGHEVKDALWALPTFEQEGLLERWRDEV